MSAAGGGMPRIEFKADSSFQRFDVRLATQTVPGMAPIDQLNVSTINTAAVQEVLAAFFRKVAGPQSIPHHVVRK
jgi:hypothetical protein